MSFILRQVFKQGGTQNRILGDRYEVIKKEEQPEKFKEALGVTDHHPDSKKKIFAVMFHDNNGHQHTYPLYEGHRYYVMTESGSTFEQIKK